MALKWKGCDECGKQTKNIRIIKGKFLCYNCSIKFIEIIPGLNQIFEEPLTENIMVSFNLTKSQKEKLVKRIHYLYPINYNSKKLKGISVYLRALVLGDLENGRI